MSRILLMLLFVLKCMHSDANWMAEMFSGFQSCAIRNERSVVELTFVLIKCSCFFFHSKPNEILARLVGFLFCFLFSGHVCVSSHSQKDF